MGQCYIPVRDAVMKGFGKDNDGLVWERDAIGGVMDGLNNAIDKMVDGGISMISVSCAGKSSVKEVVALIGRKVWSGATDRQEDGGFGKVELEDKGLSTALELNHVPQRRLTKPRKGLLPSIYCVRMVGLVCWTCWRWRRVVLRDMMRRFWRMTEKPLLMGSLRQHLCLG